MTKSHVLSYLKFQIVVPRGPIKAKGLLLGCIRNLDPCIVFEPKALYRAAVEQVPVDDYVLPIGKADVLLKGLYFFAYPKLIYTKSGVFVLS